MDRMRGGRGQIVLVAAAVVAIALLSMALAYAQLGYDADREGAGAVDVASMAGIQHSLSASLQVAASDTAGRYAWTERSVAAARVRGAVSADADRLERVYADESRALTVAFDNASARRWAREHCPRGRGRRFGLCRAIGGVVVQSRAGETTVVAAAVRVRVVSPAESTTATAVLRAV
ncbi:MAG: hypothetical protein ABEK02_05255 [Haloquadratum sp.]